jgi:hypothetical protein
MYLVGWREIRRLGQLRKAGSFQEVGKLRGQEVRLRIKGEEVVVQCQLSTGLLDVLRRDVWKQRNHLWTTVQTTIFIILCRVLQSQSHRALGKRRTIYLLVKRIMRIYSLYKKVQRSPGKLFY